MRKSTASTARQQNLSVFGEMLQWVKDGMPNEKGDKVAFLADGAMVVADNQDKVKDIISASTKKQLEGEATQQQTYLIYRLSGEDVRPLKLSKAQADSLIKELKAKAKSAKPKADVKASPAKASVKAKSPAKAKKTSKKSGNAELLRSTATAVRAASKSIGKAAGELNTALDNLEALLKA